MITVIGDVKTVTGFGLAGVNDLIEIPLDKQIIIAQLSRLETQVLIIPLSYALLVEEELTQLEETNTVVVRLPEDNEEEDLIARLTREAIGITLEGTK